jgi:hypothetical protein
MNYVILSNGNKLRVKDFEKLYSPIIDPDRFFRGEMSLSECVTNNVVKKVQLTKFEKAELEEIEQAKKTQFEKAQLTNLCKQVVKEDYDPIKVEEFFNDKIITETYNDKLEEVEAQKFFRQGTENLFEVATHLLKVDTTNMTDDEGETKVIENIPVYVDINCKKSNVKQNSVASGMQSLNMTENQSKIIHGFNGKEFTVIDENVKDLKYEDISKEQRDEAKKFLEDNHLHNSHEVDSLTDAELDDLLEKIKEEKKFGSAFAVLKGQEQSNSRIKWMFDEALKAGGYTEEIPDLKGPKDCIGLEEFENPGNDGDLA